MADYFEEMNFSPPPDMDIHNEYIALARLMIEMREELGIAQLHAQHRLAPPASKEIVEQLPSMTIQEKDVKCTICLKEFELQEVVKKLPCNHIFHTQCILPWLNKTNTCPVCRYEFKTDDEGYEEYKRQKLREKQRIDDLEVLHNSMFT